MQADGAQFSDEDKGPWNGINCPQRNRPGVACPGKMLHTRSIVTEGFDNDYFYRCSEEPCGAQLTIIIPLKRKEPAA